MDQKTDVVTNMDDPELDRLRADMNRTKSDMEGTIHRMRDRFSKERMKRMTQDMVEGWWQRASTLIHERGEDLRSAADRVGHTMKENPVPFAIVGAAGVGMLAYSLFQRRGGDHDPWSEEYRIGDEGLVSEICSSEPYPESNTQEYFAESTMEEQRATGESLKERAGNVAHSMGDRASRLSEQARYRSKRIGEDFLDIVREHPFITGTAMFCMGLLGGMLIPPTREEDELMGSASDAMKEKVKEKKEEVFESAKRLAEQTKQAAEEEAEKLGFPVGE
jgi:ElaB/YqjD/DUF883 family membrane-anchored ribosome-binding protein